jgi:hypothetical protein
LSLSSSSLKSLKKTAVTIGTVILLCSTFSSNAIESVSIFISSEHQGEDRVTGFGVSALLKNSESNLGVSILSSIAPSEVIDTRGYNQHYLAWEVGAKFGYFSDVFFYAELGVDFGELALQDRDEDNRHGYYDDDGDITFSDFVDLRNRVNDNSNDIDGYVGIGAGYDFGRFQIEVFTRYRQIDGEYWKADNQAFTGIRGSISFF